MTYRRRLTIMGIAGGLCWIGYWCWYYASTCRLERMSGGRAIACQWTSVQGGVTTVMSRTAPALPVLREIVVRTFGIPVCAIVAGVVVCWLVEKLRAQVR